MSITERYIKEKRAATGSRPEENEPQRGAKGPTLKEILADKEQEDLFKGYLESEGDEELGAKLIDGDLKAADFATLEEKRKGFLEIIERSKSLLKSMDTATLTKIVEASPELQTIAGAVGREGIRAALEKNLPSVAISERYRFIDLEDAFKKMAASKKVIDKEDEDIKKWCRESGVSEKEYIDLLKTGDTQEIVDAVRSQQGIFSKMRFRKWRKFDDTLFNESLQNAEEIDQYWKDHEQDTKDLGALLQVTMMKVPEVKEALIADLRGERVEKKEPEMSFAEVKALAAKPLDEEDIEKAFTFYRTNHPGMGKDEALHKFSEVYAGDRTKKNKKGFWSTIFSAMFASRVESFMKNK